MTVVPYRLDKTFLTFTAIKNIRLWLKGEITGTVCVKNVIDEGVCVVGGFAGGVGGKVAGAVIGGVVAGPAGAVIGAAIGAVTGGVVGAAASKALSEILTEKLFGLSRADALKNAYKFLSLPSDATGAEINSRYRQMCLRLHPDKGGDDKMWALLQCAMEVIRVSKGEA